MCIQSIKEKNHSQQLYDGYIQLLEKYINSKVIPPLGKKHEEFMLKELVKRWKNHKIKSQVGFMTSRDLVHVEMKVNVKNVVLALVDRKRKGEQINKALLKDVLAIFVEIGMGTSGAYEIDFATFMLQYAPNHYCKKETSWIVQDSCSKYMVKVEECLMKEKERVGHYLQISNEQKSLDVV